MEESSAQQVNVLMEQLLELLEQIPPIPQNQHSNLSNATLNEIITALQPVPPPSSEVTETISPPNRWHTPVSVTYYVNRRITNARYFTDLQMAYLWIKNQTQLTDLDWDISSFSETCTEMDRRWLRNQTGYTVAQYEGYRFKVHYEPHMTAESILTNQNNTLIG